MSQTSPILGLPYIQAAQAQKHITHNEALHRLDTLVQLTVADDDRTAPPGSPAEGDCHIVALGATQDWAGQDNAIATYDTGAWAFTQPRAGLRAWVAADADLAVFDGTAWTRPLRNLENVSRFGLGAAASQSTPFVVRAPSGLWDAVPTSQGGSGSALQSINREGASHDAGLALQTGYVTQSLFGFFGGDALRLSTSPDGTTFRDALSIDPATGIAAQPQLPRFKAKLNYNAFIPANTWTTVPINSADENAQGAFDAVTNLFTAPASGTFMLGGAILFAQDTSPDVRMQVRLLHNGSTALSGSYGEVSSPHIDGATMIQTSTLAPLTAGDTVSLQAYFRTNSGYAASDHTAFWGYMVP